MKGKSPWCPFETYHMYADGQMIFLWELFSAHLPGRPGSKLVR